MGSVVSVQQMMMISSLHPVLIITLTIFMVTIVIVGNAKKSKQPGQLPPGPRKLPVIGNLLQMLGGLPHHRLRDLAEKYGPLMHLQLGETSNIVVSSPELAKQFLKTHDLNFASRPSLLSVNIILYNARDIAFSPYGEYWREMRKICALELLSARRVNSLRPIMKAEIGEMISSISSSSSGGAVNLSRMLISLGTAITSRTAFGKAQKQEDSFLPVLQEMTKAVGGFSLGDIFPSSKLLHIISGTSRHLMKLHKEADGILEEIIADHVARRAAAKHDAAAEADDEDLVDVLLNYKDKKSSLGFSFTNVEIKAVITDIIVAGSDTSSATVEWAMSQLMKHPDVLEKATREVRDVFKLGTEKIDEAAIGQLKYLKMVVKETFRLHTPVPLLLPRQSRETMVINGYQIPAKSKVIINAFAMARDSRHWTEPDRFNPDRFLDSDIDYMGLNFELIPFGAGRRICPGLHYGITVVYLSLANLLYHFDWKLPQGTNPQDLDLSESFGAAVRRKTDLCLVPTRRTQTT